jgi:nicotinamidase-related amidase
LEAGELTMEPLDPRRTALVIIDLQQGLMTMSLAPRAATEVVQTATALAGRFRAVRAPVVLVTVSYAADFGDALRQPVDQPRPLNTLPAGWTELVDGLAHPSDIRITKHQWGAFHGTDLDDQLRRRGITTIVLGGISTNFGVESTARQGWERGYAIVIAEDMMAATTSEMHTFSVEKIMPRISRVVKSADIAFGG